MSDIGLPWWMAIIALPFAAPGWVLLSAALSLLLAITIGRRRKLSSGRLTVICAIAAVVGAFFLPIAGLLVLDGGPLRVMTVVFVVALGVGVLFLTSPRRAGE